MKTQNPIIGRSRGSAGGMTFCKNYDKNVARAKAFEVSNPNTPAQQTQRNFFKEASQISATVSDDELRTLFPQKPKAMSRRNSLTQQIAAANSTVEGVKSVDFSKIERIGNGKQVPVAMYETTSVANANYTLEETDATLGVAADSTANFIVVIFNATTKSVTIANTNLTLASQNFNPTSYGVAVGDHIFYYPVTATDGGNVYLRGFGSFIIKTRAEKTGRKISKNVPIN